MKLRIMKSKLVTLQIIVVCLIILFTITGCKKEVPHDGYSISGVVKGLENGWVKLIQSNFADRGSQGKVIDSAKIENGVFTMKGKMEHIDMVGISIDEKYRAMRGFFLENSTINLDIDLAKADKYHQFEPDVSGSKAHDEYVKQEAVDQSIFSHEKYAPLVALREEMSKAYSAKDDDLVKKYQEKATSLRDLSNARQEEYQMSKINYVKNNPDSPVSPYVLSFQFSEGRMSKDRMKEVYKVFAGDAKKTAMFQYMEKTYTEIFESLGEGAKAPDFTLKTPEGKNLTLSQVKGKYIFVDFWASWCVPCRASFPHLKEVYAKYHKDGFEVVAVGTADIGEKWKKAIEEDQTVWNHVFDGDANKTGKGKSAPYGSVAKAYGVPFLQTTFLLDENGIILGRQLRGKALDAKLKELYGY